MKHMAQENVQKPEPKKEDAPVAKPELATKEAPKAAEWEKIPEDKKAEQVEKIKHTSDKVFKLSTELEEKRKSEKVNKDFLKEKYNYESTAGYPPDINPEDAGVDEHYLWKIKWEREKLEKDSVPLLKEKHEAETALISEYKTLEWLSPESKKAAEKAIQREYLRKSLSYIPLDNPVIKWFEEEAKIINPLYETLAADKKYQILMRTPKAKEKMEAYLDEYAKIDPESMNDTKIIELAKNHFWIESLSGEEIGLLELPKNEDILKNSRFVEAAKRGIEEKNLEELTKLRWDSLNWKDLPDSIKMAIQFDPYFTLNETELPVSFREEMDEMRAIAREERRPDETVEEYAARNAKTSWVTVEQAKKMGWEIARGRDNMSPLGRFLADLLAPLFALLPGYDWEIWRNYMRENPLHTWWTVLERSSNGYAGGGGGGEINGDMPGYSMDVNGEITESEKQAIKIIHEAFKLKVSDVSMQEKLLAILERHAKNNPNFRVDQPFLAHDVGTKQAFVFFPPGEVVVCWATHGYGGVWNVNGGGGTSMWSKALSEWWDWNGMDSRTIVHGLENCNKNDEQRLIRVHESRWPDTKTAGCTGLDPEVAERLQQAVKTAGGGAQETFNSNTVHSNSSQIAANWEKINPDTEKARETKEQMTKIVSYDEAKELIQSGVPPTDPPTIYKIDRSSFTASARYRGNTDPNAGEDAANRNLTEKWKEYIAVHGTASSDISGFNMMLDSWLYPYFVTTKWLIFQGADDMTTGSCVSSDKANPNMSKYGLDNFNNRWIAIELSQEKVGIWGTEITTPQKKAAQELISVLRWVHNIGAGNVITSADPVRDLNTGKLLPWDTHGDDFDDSDRSDMGIALSGDVRNRLKTGTFFSDEMATNESIRQNQESSSQEQVNESGAGSFWEFIYWYEARLDGAGKVTVYNLPRWDQWGSYEVAGINNGYHPQEAARLASLIRSWNQEQAKREAIKYIEQFTQAENKVVSQNKGVNFMMLDSTFHRWGGGSASIASYILDGQFSTNWDQNKQSRWNQLEKQDPRWLISRIRDAREGYELYKFGRRSQFWAGFESRWDKAQRQANSLS
jgi:hypothetical protein